MNPIKYWAVFAVGVAAGATVALLYAPQTGEKTRRQVRRKFEDASDYVKDTADTITDQAGKVYKASREAVNDAVGSAGNVYETATKRVQKMI